MATEGTTPEDRPEAMQRVAAERDQFKAENAQMRSALEDVTLEKRAMAHFTQAGIPNAYDVANLAISEIRGVEPEQVGDKLTAWYERQTQVFAAPQPVAADPAPEPSSAPPPASPFTNPNPAAPGDTLGSQVMVLGSDKFKQWRQGKTGEQVMNAMRTGQVVPDDKTEKAHKTFA